VQTVCRMQFQFWRRTPAYSVLGSIFSSLGSIPAYVGGALNNNRCLIDFSEIFGSTQRFTSTVTYPYFTIQNRKAITHSPGFGSRPYSIFFLCLLCVGPSLYDVAAARPCTPVSSCMSMWFVCACIFVYVHMIYPWVYAHVRPRVRVLHVQL
jgi:hypothetical protein